MTFMIRFILVGIIVYLIVRSFTRYFEEKDTSAREQEREKNTKSKGVSKEIGEYVDYEEVD